MKKVAQYLFLLSTLVWFSNCSKDDVYVPPSAVTMKSETMPSGGVKLYGDFRNFSTNDIVGFNVYGDNYFQSFILNDPKEGENSLIINSGLFVDRTYTYVAYIQTDTEYFYGLEESFKSTGSILPTFLSLSPNEGDFGEEVKLTLDQEIVINRFTDLAVLFNNEKTYARSVEKNVISLKVPYYSGNKDADIKVDYFGKVVQTSLEYSLAAPVITSVSPGKVTFGDEITITGSHFEDQNYQFLKVLINEHEATVMSRSKTELVVRIPSQISKKQLSVKVISNLQEVIREDIISMKSPIISEYPQSGNINDYLILKGQNFNPDYHKNEVYFENRKANVVNGNANSITVEVPDGVFSSWNPMIKVKVSDELVSFSHPFSVLDAAIRIKEDVNITIHGYKKINDHIYVYGIDIYKPGVLDIYKYSPENNEFFDQTTVDMPSTSYPLFVETDTNYIYLYYNKEASNFYRIDLITGTIEQLPDFPGTARYIGQVASYNESIYMGAGGTNDPYNNINYKDFYAYHIASNAWSQKPDLIFEQFPLTRYQINANNRSFVFKGSNALSVYKFNGDVYEKLDFTIDHPFDHYFSYNYIFKDNLFYLIETRANIRKNRMRIFNPSTYEFSEIIDVLPNRYTIIGVFSDDQFVYLHTIDYQYVRHLLKFDLDKL